MPTKIGFVLVSGPAHAIPSTRIAVLNMLPYLEAAGFAPHILHGPEADTHNPDVGHLEQKILDEGFEIVVFQKVFGPSALRLARSLRSRGVRTVFLVCDFVLPDMAEATDLTIVVTEHLKSLYPPELRGRIRVVHDGVERLDERVNPVRPITGSKDAPLRAVLVTSASLDRMPVLRRIPEWLSVEIVGAYSGSWSAQLRRDWWQFQQLSSWDRRLRFLRFASDRRLTRTPWGPDEVYRRMKQADIGIIPIEPDSERDPRALWRVKSENRLTLMMAMGLSVVATPIPAYEAVVRQGVDGFLAPDEQTFIKSLNALRDPVMRETVGANARQTALSRYSIALQAERLIAALGELSRSTTDSMSASFTGSI
jgi:hypothetical protein